MDNKVIWNNTEKILPYILAGKSTFTLQSEKLGIRHTYKVTKDKNQIRFYVYRMFGPDNENNYRYIGLFYKDTLELKISKASQEDKTSMPFKMFRQFLELIHENILSEEKLLPDTCLFYPSGHCARCGRLLTTPESIERGLGPECYTRS